MHWNFVQNMAKFQCIAFGCLFIFYHIRKPIKSQFLCYEINVIMHKKQTDCYEFNVYNAQKMIELLEILRYN